MNKLMQAYELTKKLIDCRDTCKMIYGDRWEETKDTTLKALKQVQKDTGGKKLIVVATEACKGRDEKQQLVILGSVYEEISNKS